MKIYHSDEIYHWMIWGVLINLINFALLTLAVWGHFDTFPDGWLDGWLGGEKVKNKDQLSLAGTEVEAELGNKYILFKPKYVLPLPNRMIVHTHTL